jgi:diguanylate cyclase (GGDEF)-like protein
MPMASSTTAAQVAGRLREAVETHTFSVRADKLIEVGLSVGIACFPDDGETSEELLTAAARKMQQDKHGRKTVLTLAHAPISSIEVLR